MNVLSVPQANAGARMVRDAGAYELTLMPDGAKRWVLHGYVGHDADALRWIGYERVDLLAERPA